MKKCVFLVTDVHEGGIEPGHQFLHFCHVNVADGIGYVAALLLERHKTPILEKRYRHFAGLHIYDQFAFH